MIAFRVYLNGRTVCTAGVGDDGVLAAHVTWVGRTGKRARLKKEELNLDVGGLMGSTEESVRWQDARPLRAGDSVLIEVAKLGGVDEPPIRRKLDAVKDEEWRKNFVKEMVKQLGWKLIIPHDAGYIAEPGCCSRRAKLGT